MYDVGKCLLTDRLMQSHMSQQDLANRLGLTRQQINAYSKNRKVMDLITAKNIANELNCEMGELYEWKSVDRLKRR